MSPRSLTAVFVVVVLGLPLALAPVAVPAPDGTQTYDAVAVDPERDAAVVADRVDEVRNLTATADTTATRRLLTRAANGEPVAVPDDSPLSSLAGTSGYAVFDGDYYRLRTDETASTDRSTPATDDGASFRLTLRPVAGETVLSELATPYAGVRPDVRRVVETGEATVSPAGEADVPAAIAPDRVPSVVVRNGTYYTLDTASDLAPLTDFVAFYLHLTVLPVIGRLGVTYLVAAFGVAALVVAAGRRAAVTPRRAVGIVAAVAVVQLVVAVVQTPVGTTAAPAVSSLPTWAGTAVIRLLVAVPATLSTLPVAAGLVVGVVLRQGGRRLAAAGLGVAGLVGVHAVVAAGLAGSPVTAAFVVVADGVGLAAAIPVVVLGSVHGVRTDGTRPGR